MTSVAVSAFENIAISVRYRYYRPRPTANSPSSLSPSEVAVLKTAAGCIYGSRRYASNCSKCTVEPATVYAGHLHGPTCTTAHRSRSVRSIVIRHAKIGKEKCALTIPPSFPSPILSLFVTFLILHLFLVAWWRNG